MENRSFSTDKFDTVTFVSLPGAGKGTVIEAIERDGFPHTKFEVGTFCRQSIRNGTQLGEELKQIPKGKLVPDATLMPHVASALRALPVDKPWILDGIPRTPQQCALYIDWMRELGRRDIVVHLELHPDPIEAKKISEYRMESRGKKAGANARADDTDPEARATRLQEADAIFALVEMLKDSGQNRELITIDASQTPEQVMRAVRQSVLSKLSIAPPPFALNKRWLVDGVLTVVALQ